MKCNTVVIFVTFKKVFCLGFGKVVCVCVWKGAAALFPLEYNKTSHLVALLPAAYKHKPIRIVGDMQFL